MVAKHSRYKSICKAAALLTVTQMSYMPQKFSLLIQRQVEAWHKNLFVRDLKSFM